VTTLNLQPDRLEDAIRRLEDEEVPRSRELDGFKGFTLLVDRASGKLVGTTFWDSEQAMLDSDAKVAESRARAAEAGGASGEPLVERFEVAVDTMA
jgi:heme-degrading monooxygenase HmoA